MKNLTYNSTDFLLDGKPYRILSGAIHYFRVHPDYWEDRLKKLKACGFNTVETYCCWNLHEKQEGSFDFTNFLDIGKFLDIANSIGLNAIVRIGPYICAEFDYGGLPYWLNNYNMNVRCYDELFLSKMCPYVKRLCEEIKPHLASNGGNVIAMQVENEYGSYGNDKKYLQAIADMYNENSMDCLYFTSDGPTDFMLTSGMLKGTLATVNFGSQGKEASEILKKYQPNAPFMCMEFWDGWFDHWGEPHHIRPSEEVVREVEEVLDQNGSINMYMFHGGTNFGFMNGANHTEKYMPTITSYDYNAPLTEWGDMTPTYYSLKEAFEKRFGKTPNISVENLPKKAYGKVTLNKRAALFDNLENLSTPIESSGTKSMEELCLPFGFVIYSTTLRGDFTDSELSLKGMRDRALIYLNGELKGIKEFDMERNDKIMLTFKNSDDLKLDILVENMGRTNYGPKIAEKKGISDGVYVSQVKHFGWTQYPMELTDLSKLVYIDTDKEIKNQPIFLTGTFNVEEKADTFIRLDGFTKGNVFVNGFNIGRYWNPKGPQKTLYIPAPLLNIGENEIIVFELEGTVTNEITLTDTPDLG